MRDTERNKKINRKPNAKEQLEVILLYRKYQYSFMFLATKHHLEHL